MEVKTMSHSSRSIFLLVVGVVALALALIVAPTPVAAGGVSWTSPDGTVAITYNFPDSYSSCMPSDVVYTTGLPQNWKIMGQYSFYDMSVTPPVRLAPFTNQTSIGANLQQQIIYPPVNSWPLTDPATNTRTIWVSAVAVIFNENNVMVAQLQAGGISHKWTVTCTPPAVVEACTPGYWRNHPESWVGYDPNASFNATFSVNYFDPNFTLMQAAWAGGGGLNKVARFGVAALLSATHPDLNFALSPEQAIALVQAGNGDGLSSYFPADAVCPLN
jgi:hypothetical protein